MQPRCNSEDERSRRDLRTFCMCVRTRKDGSNVLLSGAGDGRVLEWEILEPQYFGLNAQVWSVEELEYVRMPCPYMEEFGERSNESLIGDEIVEKQMRFLHAFMDSSLEDCVGKKETIKAFWAHVRAIAGANPSSLSADWMATFIVLRRLHD